MSYQDRSDKEYQTIEYYNQNSGKFIKNTVNLDVTSLYIPFLKELRPDSLILDAGCGSGRDSLFFLQHGFQVIAFDAAEEMVKTAGRLTGLDVKQMRFEDLDYSEEFAGIWACASLLHVPRTSIDSVIEKLIRALKPDGILYVSFKYGQKEEFRNGRLFNDYSKNSFLSLVGKHSKLKTISMWITADVRTDRDTEKWLNALLKKV